MEHQAEELYSLLVPLYQGRLIVPRACIAEVIRYTSPVRSVDGPSWFRGSLSWNQLQVPIVCFEELCGLKSMEPGGRTRVAIFHALSAAITNGFFGILTEGFPQLVRVNRDVMELDDQHAWPEDGPVICQVRMINEYPLIPDLERVEEMVQACLSASR